MTSSDRTIVLGFAARLDPKHFDPFVISLKRSGFRGRAGLVVAHYDDASVEHFRRMFDFVVGVDRDYQFPLPVALIRGLRRMRNTRGVRRAYPAAFRRTAKGSRVRWQQLEYELEGLQALRYFHYRDALQHEGADADYVLLSDVRDVIFQRDPFSPMPTSLELFLEEEDITIGSEPHNRRWIRALFGEAELRRLAPQVVSCSGTVLGPRADVMRYLDQMCTSVEKQWIPLGSHDQGIHNHLLRAGRLDPALVVPNRSGRVLTMGGMKDIPSSPEGAILNTDGSHPPVLHQYDRHPELALRLMRRLGTDRAAAA